MSQSGISEAWEPGPPPVEAPNRWHGNRAEHTGRTIFCRIWRIIKDHDDIDMDEYLEVGYNGDFAGATFSPYVPDEDYACVFKHMQVSDNSDVACAGMATHLMKRHASDGN